MFDTGQVVGAGEASDLAYARVQAAPRQEPVQQPAERPALVAPVASAVEEGSAADATPTASLPGVATLRPHRVVHGSEGPDELPRRVRQANLAPQLRGRRPDPPAPAPDLRGPRPDERTPELVRDRMAAYRDGWVRGGGRAPGHRATTPDHVVGGDTSEGDPA
ncbi:hypothetical protein FNH08_17355 [Streptomyces spongiae]|uniref:Uncharacterized protein n=1 Tax=Streptomyces spongiae TaxID=565072 RepID=A0A5N8XHD2_9ACTN|nr:hypothetical protein [Streptomyces spongiae]